MTSNYFESDPLIARVRKALLPIEISDASDATTRQGQRRAAVLMPLVKRSTWRVILTQRPDTMPTHAGQIAFPGGRAEVGETALDAALRETNEEIGVPPYRINLLGRLPSFDANGDFRVTPYVGIVDPAAELNPDPREVADVFEVPFRYLMDPQNHIRRDVEWNAQTLTLFDMPYDDNGTHRNIWGMTAMMMYRLWQRGFQT